MGARCHRGVSPTTPPVGFISRRRWRSSPTPAATTARGHPMSTIKTLIARRAAMGFTLIEALIAAVILAAAVGAMVAPMSATYIQSRTIKQTNIALSMAQQLLDEVVSKHFADPTDASVVTLGPDSGESGRATFDNMDDYHG